MAVLTARKASVLFANHDPMRPYMDTVLALANSVGESATGHRVSRVLFHFVGEERLLIDS